MIDLSIIVVTYNSGSNIGNLLDSIAKSKDNLNKEVIIVDNASQDNSVEVVRHHRLKIILIQSPTNLGFPKAANLGIQKAMGEFIMLINPDTELVGNCLQILVDFATRTTPLGAVAPKLLDPNGQTQGSVFHLPNITNAIKRYYLGDIKAFGKYVPDTSPVTVDAAVMAALLVPRTTFEAIGLLDERFFMYYEDIEFGKRLKKNHLPLYYLASAKIKHVHGASGHFVFHLKSPLLASSKIYYGEFYSTVLNLVLWLGHKWQVLLRGKKFRD